MIKHLYKITEVSTNEEVAAIEKKIADGLFKKYYDYNAYKDQIFEARILKVDEKVDIFLLDEFMLSKTIAVTSNLGYKMVVQDVTSDFFNGKMPIPEEIKETVQEYITQHFDVNDVLDKMLDGYELSEVDKLILSK